MSHLHVGIAAFACGGLFLPCEQAYQQGVTDEKVRRNIKMLVANESTYPGTKSLEQRLEIFSRLYLGCGSQFTLSGALDML